MVQKLLIEVIKNDKKIGSCFYKYEGCMLLALDKIKSIIDNYNTNLAGRVMGENYFAIRLLQEQNYEGSLRKICPELRSESETFAKKTYIGFDFNQMTDNVTGSIAITPLDLVTNQDDVGAGGCVIINFDTKKISLHGLHVVCNETEYIKINGLNPDEFDTNSIDEYYINFEKINFFDLEEFSNFVKKHKNGWKLNSWDKDIIVPIS